MAAIVKGQFKVTAQDGTTVTLQPTAQGAHALSRDLASPITTIVITMTARDSVYFDVTNRVFDIEIEKR